MKKLLVYREAARPDACRFDAPGLAVEADLAQKLDCEEPGHLRTWLEVQLREAGRLTPQGDFVAADVELQRLAAEFATYAADRELRLRTANEAVGVQASLPNLPQYDELKVRLLQFGFDWGSAEAGGLLLENLLRRERYSEARAMLGALKLEESQWLLAAAEIAVLEEHFDEALTHLNRHLDLLLADDAAVDLDAIAQVLQSCLQYPQLADIFEHSCVQLHRAQLRAAAQGQEYTELVDRLKPTWVSFVQRRPMTILAIVAVAGAMMLFRAKIVQVVAILMLPLGLVGVVLQVLRRRKAKR